MSNNKKIIGIFTDGDLRRCLNNEIELNKTLIKDVMTSEFKSISSDALAIDAAEIMEKNKSGAITCLGVTSDREVIGFITIQDLLQMNS